MERLDFYGLSRSIQERLAGVTKGQGVPAVLAVSRSLLPPKVPLWIAVSCAGLLGLLLSYEVGLGDLDSSVAIQPTRMIASNAVFATAFALGLLRTLAILRDAANLPFRRGVYLFPTVVVDATRRELHVFRLQESARIDTSNPARIGVSLAEGLHLSFDTNGLEHGAEIASAIAEGQAALSRATAAGDKAALAALDPLSEPNFVNPFTPKKAIEFVSPAWAKYSWALGPVVGVLLGATVYVTHNGASDARMLVKAKTTNTPQAYQQYLERGGKDRDARDVLLPRAELREAIRAGTVQEIERFAVAHPTSRIDDEVKIALRNSMLLELDRLAKQGSIAAIVDFRKRHDTKLVAAELERALHGLYRAAFERYKSGAAGNTQALAVIDRLVDYAEKHGTRVEVRFQRKVSKTVETADAQVKKSPSFRGQASFVSQYFDEKHARAREQESGQKLVARFNEAFPSDVLQFELAAPVTDPDAPLPQASTPTLFIEHLVQCSGPPRTHTKPRGVFVGVGFNYDVTLRVPDDARSSFKWKTTTWRSPDLKLEPGSGSLEETVYGAAANDSFRLLVQRLLQVFFKNAEHATLPAQNGAAMLASDTARGH